MKALLFEHMDRGFEYWCNWTKWGKAFIAQLDALLNTNAIYQKIRW